PLLLSENFKESLEWLAALMKERYGLKVELKEVLLPNWPGEEVCNLLIQIVRELLFNVVKHDGVNQAIIEVSEEDGRLRVEVSDRGQGFDVAVFMTEVRQRSGLGLVSIRNRLELFGGWFHIESQVGRGTRVAVVVLI
ncbi:MAG TPA: ATP-binding protein, partial [Anaerolineae bacterium]